jgi:hypothetical protein
MAVSRMLNGKFRRDHAHFVTNLEREAYAIDVDCCTDVTGIERARTFADHLLVFMLHRQETQ